MFRSAAILYLLAAGKPLGTRIEAVEAHLAGGLLEVGIAAVEGHLVVCSNVSIAEGFLEARMAPAGSGAFLADLPEMRCPRRAHRSDSAERRPPRGHGRASFPAKPAGSAPAPVA